MIGQTISHYKITDKLGAGGMGEVYLAEDTELDRRVAIKFLPSMVRPDADTLKRFKREARAAAALNHPNIITVYDIGTHDGHPYIVMEHVDGESLTNVIEHRDLSVKRALEIAIQMVDGLSAAHDAGIVHRDIKPDNILIDHNGRVRILDFGLAKLHGATVITAEDTTVGTAAYMSPEQTRGSAVDARSDIFSAGAVLYEMVAGRRPFAGDHRAAVLYAITNEAPQPLRRYNTHVGDGLERMMAKLLAKDPDSRYASAKDVIVDLRAERGHEREKTPGSRRMPGKVAAAAASVALVVLLVTWGLWWAGQRGTNDDVPTVSTPAIPELPAHNSIAVLPFVDMSPEKDQEYFSDGVAEELLNLLAKIPELRVTSRSSAFSFKGKDLEIPEIARRLDVAHILEGSVRKSGDRVRITAQLIEAGTDSHLWSQSYDRTLDDIFAIQDEIAADVVAQLRVTLLGETPRVRETDSDAYALYLQGRHLLGLRTAESMERAIEKYREALAIDPDYAPLWVALSDAYWVQIRFGLRPYDEGYQLSREAANRALVIDPNLPLGHVRLGRISEAFDRDLDAAARHLQRALELAPGDYNALTAASGLAINLGRIDEAVALREHIVALDPVSPQAYFRLGFAYLGAGRLDEAVESMRTGLALRPDAIAYRSFLGEALTLNGDADAGLALIESEPDEGYRLLGLIVVNHTLGRRAASDSALALAIEKHERAIAYNIAGALAYRGEADRAFVWLGRAVEYDDPGLTAVIWDTHLSNLYSDPRWLPFLESIGKSPEQLAAIEFHVTLPK